MEEFDFDEFEADLLDVTQELFQSFQERADSKSICAFALYSDESASTVSASLNLTSHLTKMMAQNPDAAGDYKWSPAEWQYEGLGEEEMDKLSNRLSDVFMDMDDEDELEEADDQFLEFREQIFNRCVSVLKKLKQEGLFEKVNTDFVLMFDVSDYSDPVAQIGWVRQLNDEVTANEFAVWLAGNE